MATLQELEAAFIKADDAGNADDARVFAAEIRRLRSAKPPMDEATEIGVDAAQRLGFDATDPSQVTDYVDAVKRQGVPFVQGLRQGTSVGFAPMAEAALRAATDKTIGTGAFPDPVTKQIPPSTFGGRYEAALAAIQERDRQQKAISPAASIAGQVLGGAISSAPLTAAAAPMMATGAGRIASGAGISAIEGGLSSAAKQAESALIDEGLSPADKAGAIALAGAKGAGIGGGIGLLSGGALEAGRVVANTGSRLLRRFTPGGRDRILGEALREGVPENAIPGVTRELRSAQPIVPGSLPTAAEAVADNPAAVNIAGLQETLRKMPTPIGPGEGSIAAAFTNREAASEAARQRLLGGIARTPADKVAAEAARSAASRANYGRVENDVVNAVTPTEVALFETPAMQKAMKAAGLAAANMQSPVPTPAAATVRDLQTVKEVLDKMTKNPADYDLPGLDRSIADVRARFVQWLGQKSPGWQAARVAHAVASQDIDEMAVGQGLQRTLASKLGSGERPSAFATALEEVPRSPFLKRITGEQRYNTIADLSPRLDQAAQSVLADLQRGARADSLARGISIAPGAHLPGDVRLPQMLERSVMIANAILRRSGKTAADKVNARAAQAMLDPPVLADIIDAAAPSERKKIVAAIMSMMTAGAAQTATPDIAEGLQ